MNLVDRLSLKFKLYSLLAIVIAGLLLIGGIGYFNMHKMKKNLDALYFGSLIPVTELNRIQNEYNKEILISFYQLQHHEISPSEAAEKISLSRKKILSVWNTYKSHFKRDYELSYVDYTQEELIKSSTYLKRLSDLIMHLDSQGLERISSNILIQNLSHMDKIVENIIEYESKVAQYERKSLLNTYNETMTKLIVILILIIASAVIIIVPIFQSIHNNQISLLHASKKLQMANKKLETASITDALTELYNRRYFNLVYNRELTRCIREAQSLAFMMIDIDYFKGYNDYYGHLDGDGALKAVAKVMKENLKRPGDYLFRLGGEEFGVLIANIDEEKAYHMAERLRLSVQALKIEHKRSKCSKVVTISVGVVVTSPDQDVDSESILQAADEYLYDAKAQGRNRVVISETLRSKSA